MLGVLIHFLNSFVFVYYAIFFVFGTYWVVKNNDRDFQVLTLLLYIVAFEVLFRMKSGGTLYDIGKYSIIYFCVLGFAYKRISLKDLLCSSIDPTLFSMTIFYNFFPFIYCTVFSSRGVLLPSFYNLPPTATYHPIPSPL